MAKHVAHPVDQLESRALHLDEGDAAAIAAQRDRAAGLGGRGAHAGLDQLLDLSHQLGVIGLAIGFRRLGRLRRFLVKNRIAGHEMLHDHAENHRIEMLPLDIVGLGDGDEVGAEKHPGHRSGGEQARRQGRAPRRLGIPEVERPPTAVPAGRV